MTGRAGSLRNRSLLGPVDQALSSLTNFVPAIVVASSSETRAFGLISLSLLLTTLGLGVTRSVVSEVVLAPGVRFSSHDLVGPLSGGILVALTISILLVAAGAPFAGSGGSGSAVLIAGIGLPAVAFQDLGRYMAFGRMAPGRALIADGLWLLLLVPMLFTDSLDWTVVFLAWAAAGAVSSVVMYLDAPLLDARVSVGMEWITRNKGRSARFTIEFVSVAGASLIGLSVLAMVAGPSELGTVRGVQLVGSPVLILIAGLSLTLPATIRELSERRSLLAANRIVSSVAAGASAVAAIGLMFLPSRIGEPLLGETWASVEPLLPWLIPYLVFGAAGVSARSSLRLVGGERVSAYRQAVWTAPIGVAGPVFGYSVAGTPGALFMIAFATLVGALVYQLSFRAVAARFAE